MSVAALEVLPGGRPEPLPWEAMLLDAVRAEFRVEVYHPVAGDAVLYGPTCAVSGCPGRGVNRSLGLKAKGVNRSIGAHFRGYLCLSHVRMWRRDGEPPIDGWVRHCARALRTQQLCEPCAIAGCPRSELLRGLCGAHHHQWERAGRPSLEGFAPSARPVRTVVRHCVVAGCTFAAISRDGFCDGHAGAYRNVRYSHPGLTPDGYLEHLGRARAITAPSYDMRGLPSLVALEMQLALQCRQEARRGQMQPLTFGQVTRWVLDEGVASVLDRGEAHWAHSAERRFAPQASSQPAGLAAFHPSVRAAAA